MSNIKTQYIRDLHIRAELPRYLRFAAVLILIATLISIGIGYYLAKNDPTFRMKGLPTSLSKDVVATVNGYERREVEGDVVKYYIKSDKATTFSDEHQEMENIFLQVFDPSGLKSDQITGQKAIYIPGENKSFKVFLTGDVNIKTRDGLNVKTAEIVYDKAEESATAEGNVEFNRLNVSGTSIGAAVKVAEKTLELMSDVKIHTIRDETVGKVDFTTATINASHAFYNQATETIDLIGGVKIVTDPGPAKDGTVSDVQAARANILLSSGEGGISSGESETATRDLRQFELFENVEIATNKVGESPTRIWAGYAMYEAENDRFVLKDNVRILTVEDEKPTNINASEAVYERKIGKVNLNVNAEITQGTDIVKGDNIIADLNADRKLKNALVRGNAYLLHITPERETEIKAMELTAAFTDGQYLISANATGGATTVITPINEVDYSRLTMFAQNSINVRFGAEGRLEQMRTDGRTTLNLDVPNNASDAANKRLTADSVKTVFDGSGKNLARAEAAGNAELVVEPLRAGAENYRTIINAPRFDCDFYPMGSNAKSCVAATKTRTVRVPTVSRPGHGEQVVTADRLTANFNQSSRDVEQLDAAGHAKFVELDRNAVADAFSFNASDGIVRLRGGEPSAWDSASRAKAREIDWNTREQVSFLRGGVSTTYYSQQKTGGAVPFTATQKPVFLTSNTARFDHVGEIAFFEGNARGWQENNYVRAEKMVIEQKTGKFSADGSVQSLLYNATRREKDRVIQVPVYASSKKMGYNRMSRVLRYEDGVDIRQGTDRIISEVANVFLTESGDVVRTDVERNVVITQPNRRATGDFAQYFAEDERVILRGNPAKVDDAEKGSSQGGEITIFLKENRVVGVGKSNQNPSGRVRSVYKVKNN